MKNKKWQLELEGESKKLKGSGFVRSNSYKALIIIPAHKLTAKSYGCADLIYINKFNNSLQDLKDLDTPYDPRMTRANFHVIFEDEAYNITRRNNMRGQ